VSKRELFSLALKVFGVCMAVRVIQQLPWTISLFSMALVRPESLAFETIPPLVSALEGSTYISIAFASAVLALLKADAIAFSLARSDEKVLPEDTGWERDVVDVAARAIGMVLAVRGVEDLSMAIRVCSRVGLTPFSNSLRVVWAVGAILLSVYFLMGARHLVAKAFKGVGPGAGGER